MGHHNLGDHMDAILLLVRYEQSRTPNFCVDPWLR